ncbi:hypothetical protein BDZ94DRAFT_1267706 [Collybia nuda]|uniref:Uncharacterized protein n=1 Tax=Collybia nuda TaxID=64659 RepID=A0A9P6CG49_9AGAR|nr:hypothetical protein BDZ94DRAFT_1267706 [Collybia nuda]
MSLSLSTPLSLYSIPIVWFLGFYPNVLKGALITKAAGSYNNVAPRTNVSRLTTKKVDPEITARVARMEAAHMNGNENFPIWAAAVLAGHVVGIDHQTLNTVALAHIILRIMYNYIYINQSSQIQGAIRSAIWTSAISLPFYLFIKAANIVRVR